MRMVVSHCTDLDSKVAASGLVARAAEGLGMERPAAGLLFCGDQFDALVLVEAVLDAFGDFPLIGCTTDGEMSSSEQFQEDSAVLLLFVGNDVVARAAIAVDLGADPRKAVAIALAAANFPGTPAVCIAAPESLTADAVAVVGALNDALPGTAVVGGTAADGWKFIGTRQFCGRTVLADALPLLLLGGDFAVDVGVASGWRPLGRRARVTKGDGSRVTEIDGAPAVAFYQEYLGEHIEPHPAYPILVFENEEATGYLRTPFKYEPETGAIVFAAEVPVGSMVQVTTAPTQDILEACKASVSLATGGGASGPILGALVVSCAARKQLLGTRTDEECRILGGALGADVPFAGFYAYGEIGPPVGAANADFHNESFVAVVFRANG